ncbi:MAG: Holliday junction branch migration protein RuvA [Oscillospiraceae bacterium]|nr:Holliday junction branch migration protein RuvA [Oscillospiraceae bacterium]
MFYSLTGTVTLTEPYLAVVDCGGVSYACNTTLTTLAALTRGETATLYTYLHVREDIFDLYGFSTRDELRCFKRLLGISGVGPRAAQTILSANTPERLALAILTGDEKALTTAPGIGKKTAQRIILELKDQLAKEQKEIGGSLPLPENAAGAKGPDKYSEAAAALAVLGYSASEAAAALKGVEIESSSLEDIIREALRHTLK